ncbi:phosphomannomutase CpsG [Thorsellia anophelis]|uniref:Phosphomannomutase n=1 Tax=Thorsellia anophelis DSM 18579 TaxID=1123402 RepID=A0A1I0AFJ9_9GAMM|nr:phosphomannomutase CpsG [Thorsellia anophelis]SES93021.1 phosphomannomutase [Thorsellia anophelis DSM 18579]
MDKLSCFKSYDIRGKIGIELDELLIEKIGFAFATQFRTKNVVVGGDARATSELFKKALIRGLNKAGSHAIDLGMTGTEEIYFATRHLQTDGGIQVTASHNPINYNGLKIVLKNSHPLSNDNGLLDIKAMISSIELPTSYEPSITQSTNKKDYITHILSYLDLTSIKPLRIVVNAGNGAAGPVVDALEAELSSKNIPIELIKIHNEPDSSFPNGIPNPLLVENRAPTSKAIIEHKADFGVAWDGDFDRCFLFDENGQFIEGYYIVGLLAQYFLLNSQSKEKIIHDPRLYWNTKDICESYHGIAIESKTGHAFLKDIMRKENAVYGGEMSAHHYFRDFGYCDSGMIPWLLVVGLLSKTTGSLSHLVEERINLYPSSGEINQTVKNPKLILEQIEEHFKEKAIKIDHTDGLSIEFEAWRFNLRESNTEPLLRLNVESRGDIQLMKTATDKLLSLINLS